MKKIILLSSLLFFVAFITNAQSTRFKTANAQYWVDVPEGQLDFVDRIGRIARIELERQIDSSYNPEITVVYDEKLKKPYKYRVGEVMTETNQPADGRTVFKFKYLSVKKDKRVVFD